VLVGYPDYGHWSFYVRKSQEIFNFVSLHVVFYAIKNTRHKYIINNARLIYVDHSKLL